MQKTCNKCKTSKPLSDFYANKRMKDGFNTFCISCHKADNIARKAILRADPAFKKTEQEANKEYRSRTKAQRAKYMQAWRNLNASKLIAYGKAYREANKEHYNFLCQKRKVALMRRSPSWLTKDDLWAIEQAYELAALRTKMFGFKWHVDHILPLRGEKISGLHVPANLQVIPAKQNQQKTNKFEV